MIEVNPLCLPSPIKTLFFLPSLLSGMFFVDLIRPESRRAFEFRQLTPVKN
jgi:hypothetical protein